MELDSLGAGKTIPPRRNKDSVSSSRARENCEEHPYIRTRLTLTVFPGDPFPGMWARRDHFQRRVYARTRARSICMRPVRAAGCKADNKRGCCPPGLRECNSSLAPATDVRERGSAVVMQHRGFLQDAIELRFEN